MLEILRILSLIIALIFSIGSCFFLFLALWGLFFRNYGEKILYRFYNHLRMKEGIERMKEGIKVAFIMTFVCLIIALASFAIYF